MANVFDVANYFLAKTEPEVDDVMTHLKLQKLVYFAQGFHLALHNRPLFKETIEAWNHGPVCPELYKKYKTKAAKPILPVKSLEEAAMGFTQKQVQLLEDVYAAYGCFSASILRNLSHQDTAWHNAYPMA